MGKFLFRGLEIHSNRMWQQGEVERSLKFMEEYEMNALIFHQNDLINQLVLPEKYFDNDVMWDRWPTKRQKVLYQREYINRITQLASEAGAEFYLEIKEIDTCEEIFEMIPGLRRENGVICPNHPFWEEYEKARLEELFSVCPGINGLIVSLGTRESKVSAAANRCTCPRCMRTPEITWYENMIRALYQSCQKYEKKLIVRDFAFSADQQNLVLEACARVSKDITAALKAYPHDFYPTFPINPQIGCSGLREEYIEFDVWGQFFGMSCFPVSIAEDIKQRMQYSLKKGACGVWFRTDWELMHDASVERTMNRVNLLAGAMLAADTEKGTDNIYREWTSQGIYSPLKTVSQKQEPEIPQNPEAWRYLKQFMEASWEAYRKTEYILGHQFLESDQPPYTIKKAFEIMTVIHGRDDWEKGASQRVEVTEENIEKIASEKEQAVRETKKLAEFIEEGHLGISSALHGEIIASIDLEVLFAELCKAVTLSMYGAVWAEKQRTPEAVEKLEQYINMLNEIAERIETTLCGTDYPYYIYARLQPERLRRYRDDVLAVKRRMEQDVSCDCNR